MRSDHRVWLFFGNRSTAARYAGALRFHHRTVSDSITGEPLRKVRLSLSTTAYSLSGSDGGFAFHDLPPGRYRLIGERSGYLRGEYGSKRYGGRGAELAVSPGEKLERIHLRLIPQGAISGRVLDSDGDSLVQGNVDVWRYVWRNGSRELEGFNSGEIDDRGLFRVTGLPSGRYLVRAVPSSFPITARRNADRDRPAEQEQATNHPGTLDESSASPVAVGAGQEVSGIEIRIRRRAVHNIRGIVLGLTEADTKSSPMRPWEVAALSAKSSASSRTYSASVGTGGRFEFRGVPSGEYEISVVKGMGTAAALGKVKARVDDRDVEGVRISVTPPRRLRGAVTIEGGASADVTRVRIWLEAVSRSGWVPPVTANSDGAFEFELVGAEKFRVKMQLPDGLYLKSVSFGEKEAASGIVDLADAPEGRLDLLVSPKTAEIRGTIQPLAPGSTPEVWLIPDTEDAEERKQWALPGRFNQHGVFTIRDVRPGDHLLFAWDDLPEGLWKDPEFFALLKPHAVAISIFEGDRRATKLRVISAIAMKSAMNRLGIEPE